MRQSEKVTFKGSHGVDLVGRLELPSVGSGTCALFAHCFTCSKDGAAASRISRALAEQGIAVLRFDFTGLGGSDGDFENTSFSSNVQDLVAAARYLRERVGPPQILVGHSLGGAAVLIAAHEIPDCKVVATVGAPSDPAHVKRLMTGSVEEIEQHGHAQVVLDGRTFTITKQFLDDLDRQQHEQLIRNLDRALLIFHSPVDTIVGIDNARDLYVAAKHPKSFVALDNADHLLTDRADADYVGAFLAAWAQRYLPRSADDVAAPRQRQTIVRETGRGKFQQAMQLGGHELLADEPRADGGDDSGPSPYELLLGALGSCTAMTLRLYADRKQWPLERTTVYLEHEKRHAEDCAHCQEPNRKLDHIGREIALEGNLTPEQRARLLEIADRCPVHRTLHSEVRIETRERSESPRK